MAPMQQRMLDILAEALNSWDAQIPAGSWLVFFFVLVLKPYPLVNLQKAMENGHRNSGFSHEK